MANFFAADYSTKQLQANEGNTNTDDYNALGANTGTMSIADKMYIGKIPGGSRVEAITILVSTACASSCTGDLGYEPVTADDGAQVAALTYWFATQALSSTGRFTSVGKPVTLDQDMNIVLTVRGAATGTTYDITVITHIKFRGKK